MRRRVGPPPSVGCAATFPRTREKGPDCPIAADPAHHMPPRHLYPPPQRRFPLPSQAPATNPPSANPPPSAPGVLSTPSPRDCEIMTSDWRGEIGVGGVSTPSGPVLPGTMGETILHPGSGDCPEGVAIRGAWSCGANSARPRTSTRSLRAAVKRLVEGRTWSQTPVAWRGSGLTTRRLPAPGSEPRHAAYSMRRRLPPQPGHRRRALALTCRITVIHNQHTKTRTR